MALDRGAFKIVSKEDVINQSPQVFTEIGLDLPDLMTLLNTRLDTFGLVYVIVNTWLGRRHAIRKKIQENHPRITSIGY
jgi:hypothetical protein